MMLCARMTEGKMYPASFAHTELASAVSECQATGHDDMQANESSPIKPSQCPKDEHGRVDLDDLTDKDLDYGCDLHGLASLRQRLRRATDNYKGVCVRPYYKGVCVSPYFNDLVFSDKVFGQNPRFCNEDSLIVLQRRFAPKCQEDVGVTRSQDAPLCMCKSFSGLVPVYAGTCHQRWQHTNSKESSHPQGATTFAGWEITPCGWLASLPLDWWRVRWFDLHTGTVWADHS